MIIECPTCDSKVDGKVLAAKEQRTSEDGDITRTSFLECPVCHRCIVAAQDEILTDEGPGFTRATRLWPEPSANLPPIIPQLARRSLEDAQKCFSVRAYAACAVMCRRAIEAICAEHKTKSNDLAAGLKELLDKKVI